MSRLRKGISSVFSNVLLILITVLGMTALFSFTTHYVTEFQLRQGSAIMEGLINDDYWFNKSINFPEGNSSGIILNLYNFGIVGLSIKQIFIDGVPANFFAIPELNGEPVDYPELEKARTDPNRAVYQVDSIEIRIGEHGSLILNNTSIRGKYNIKIFTERNSKFEFWVWRPRK